MNFTEEDALILGELQKFDSEIATCKRTILNLEHPAKIKQIQNKEAALNEKLEKLKAMLKARCSQEQICKDKIASLSEKVQSETASLNNHAHGYRETEAMSQDIEALKLAIEQEESVLLAHMEYLEQACALQTQIEGAIESGRAAKAKLTRDYATKKQELKTCMLNAEDDKEAVEKDCPKQLMDEYIRACENAQGVGVAHLNGDTCSVCRAQFEPGRLIQIKSEAPVSHCFACKRLMLVQPVPMSCGYGLSPWPETLACGYGLCPWPATLACGYKQKGSYETSFFEYRWRQSW